MKKTGASKLRELSSTWDYSLGHAHDDEVNNQQRDVTSAGVALAQQVLSRRQTVVPAMPMSSHPALDHYHAVGNY